MSQLPYRLAGSMPSSSELELGRIPDMIGKDLIGGDGAVDVRPRSFDVGAGQKGGQDRPCPAGQCPTAAAILVVKPADDG